MIEAIVELLAESVGQVIMWILFRLPGACIRWLFVHKKNRFSELLFEDGWYTVLLSMLFYASILIIYFLI